MDPRTLIPELQQWNDGQGIDLESFLAAVGNYEFAIAFLHFSWPTFVEHDGCLFRVAPNIENYEQWKTQTGDDKMAIERVMNHVHILDMFPNAYSQVTREQIIYVGQQLREMWSAKVQRDFPHPDVIVTFLNDDSDDLLDYQITLFQNRDASATPE